MSRKVVGSSSSSDSVSWASAIAIQTRCRCPPDSSSTGRSASSATSVRSMASATARSSSSADHCRHQRWCGWRPRADQVGDRDPLGRDRGLRQQPEPPGDLAGSGARGSPAPSSSTAPPPRLEQPGQRAQQRGLAAGVGADDDGDLAVGIVQVEAVDDGAVLVGERPGPVGARVRGCRSRAASRTGCGPADEQRRSGTAPPTAAVSTPTGSSVGASSLRASRSASTTSTAPVSAEREQRRSARCGPAGGRSAGRAAPRSRPAPPAAVATAARTTPSAASPSAGRPSRTPSPRRGVVVERAGALRPAAHSSTGSSTSERAGERCRLAPAAAVERCR